MKKQELKKIIVLIFLGVTVSCSPKSVPTSIKEKRVGETVEVIDKNIDWEAYDPSSTIAKTDISIENLQGLWNAYKGVYRFGDHINAMELTTPMIIEVNLDTYRRNSKGAFEKFSIKDNLIFKTSDGKIDSGIINKISPSELVISWKNESNYTRYYYTKK